MSTRRPRGWVGLALLVSACTTVGPDYRGPPPSAVVHMPEATGAFLGAVEPHYSAEPVPGEWWRLYEDPLLEGLVQQALKSNVDLRVAAANLARSRALLAEVGAAKLPSTGVDASVGVGRVAPLPSSVTYGLGFDISYQVDLFGRIRRGIEAARADTEAVQAALDLTHITVAAETTRAYASVCSVGNEVSVARRVLALQEESLSRTRRLVEAGRGTALDLSRARAQVEALRANVPPLVAQRRIALLRLAVLSGRPPAAFPPDVEACETPPRLSSPIPVEDGAALLRRRPDVRQAERTLAAATARIGVATADLYPTVSFGLSAASGGLLESFGQESTLGWSLGPLLSWTFPNTRVARSRIAQADAAAQGALAQFDRVVLNALLETESNLTQYTQDLERVTALTAARDFSAQAAREADALYRGGREDFLTVLDAERTRANAEASLASAQTRLVSDQIALFLSLGGGWEEAPPAGGP
ncbi:outer membrane component of tripartite multidrug resistance system [Corallococcus coralloides DSM 2259]|uniref:Outer membrane component of tripartite multidrug resistance system n=1 Tax=Corallococcus coralloides (strain ATCC 25202 / DSM 2259 / NBRC 100086 / M2) TaxID=1144275 RepID=H8MM32_CORCM|nr:TolC family protein [Corallococcus coralloides]AFE09706.1 outer membrane component of tripartite multidrug resistance system [Corallococcus coralloides DSM 2259]